MRSFTLALAAGLLLASAAHAAPECAGERIRGTTYVHFRCPYPKYEDWASQHPRERLVMTSCVPSGYTAGRVATGYICEIDKTRLATP